MSIRLVLSLFLLGLAGSPLAAPPPKASTASLSAEIQDLASLMAEEQHDFYDDSVRLYPMCGKDEVAPDCRTLVLFNIGNFTGNSVTQYLAMFDPVDADIDFEDLPNVVQKNSEFRAWKFLSVIKIDSTGEVYATFDGAHFVDNILMLQGLLMDQKTRKLCIHKRRASRSRLRMTHFRRSRLLGEDRLGRAALGRDQPVTR